MLLVVKMNIDKAIFLRLCNDTGILGYINENYCIALCLFQYKYMYIQFDRNVPTWNFGLDLRFHTLNLGLIGQNVYAIISNTKT